MLGKCCWGSSQPTVAQVAPHLPTRFWFRESTWSLAAAAEISHSTSPHRHGTIMVFITTGGSCMHPARQARIKVAMATRTPHQPGASGHPEPQ